MKVRYPGYVFCKIRLVEDVYETLQELELTRSWMGTVNRKGHKKLPPAPLPLGPEEVKKFKGLEEEQELFEDMYGGDYTGRTDTGADLLDQYAGYDVGQMVKVLRGNFEGEDGTVRRLKGGQLMVRMFTYGQTYDEWFDPDAIRPLTDLEVMKGLSGPTQPINQDQFDVSIGKKDPSELEGTMMDGGGDNSYGSGSGTMRSGLLQSAGIAPGRNRREDRVARGETGNRDLFGRSADEIKKEEQNWLAYREEQRANSRGGQSGGGGDSQFDMLPDLTEAQKKKAMGPKKGQDTWGITARSSWDGGEYGFDANSEEEERERKRRTEMIYKDRPVRGGGRGGRGRDGLDSFNQRRNNNFDDRRDGGADRNEREERRPMRPSSRDNDWSTSSRAADEDGASKEDDFFDSLMSELSDDLSNDDASRDTGARVRGARSHDNAGPNTRGAEKSSNASSGAEDFFESLMSELGGALDNKPAAASSPSSSYDNDDDDFFSSLEAELSQSLGNDESTEKEEDISDDFFNSLMDDVADELELDKQKDSSSTEMLDDEGDDFFSSLLDDLDVQLEHESPVEKETAAIEQSAPQHHHDANNSDLASLTVPELKDLLRSKGLKVGGKKSELIERLQS